MGLRIEIVARSVRELRYRLADLRQRGNTDPRIIRMQQLCGEIEASLSSAKAALHVTGRR